MATKAQKKDSKKIYSSAFILAAMSSYVFFAATLNNAKSHASLRTTRTSYKGAKEDSKQH